MPDWRPGADRGALVARAQLLALIRDFFAARGVLEVETPLLCSSGVTDPALDAFVVPAGAGHRFLQTSPEYAMKRLLAAGSGDIYQICKAFRAEESGSRHNPEYTLLEWYRTGFDHHQLIREVAELLVSVLDLPGWQIWPWGELFAHFLDVDGHRAKQDELLAVANRELGSVPSGLDRNGLLDLLMSHCIEPGIADWGVVFVTDYPASQAALSRRFTRGGVEIGARFECYVHGIELANGYWECPDADELRCRFEADNAVRRSQGRLECPVDEALLDAHASGLPDCSGVALGVDRLLACRLGVRDIRTLMAFDWSRS